jgi:streptogramin lyase
VRISLMLLVLGVALVLASGSGAAPPGQPVEALVVATGKAPCGSVVRESTLWVGVYDTGKVLRIAPDGHVRARTRVGRWACRVAVGPASMWVTRDQAGEVVRVARKSGRLRRIRVGSGAFDVVRAAGFVWVSSYDVGTVSRLDPRTGRLLSLSRDGPNPAGLSWCGGRVWFGHGRQATWLSAITPATMRVERVDVGAGTPSSPRCVRGELWTTTADSVVRLDSRTGAVLARVLVGGTPADIAAGPDGLVWVTDKERSLVFRLDPAGTRIVDSFPAGPGAFALARLRGSMWVTSFAGADVRRYDP